LIITTSEFFVIDYNDEKLKLPVHSLLALEALGCVQQ
jgi:hypothetical protein